MGSRPEASYYFHDISVGLAGADSPPNHFQDEEEKGKEDAPDWGQLPSSLFLTSCQRAGSLLEGGPPGDWNGLGWGPVFTSPFLGALGSSCGKGMPTICWCSKLAPYPGRGRSVPAPSKDAGEAALPVLGVSFVRIGVWPSPSPRRGGSGKRRIPGRTPGPGGPRGPHLLAASLELQQLD